MCQIKESEKDRVRNLHRKHFILNEEEWKDTSWEEYIKAKVLYLDDKNTPEKFKGLLENQKG